MALCREKTEAGGLWWAVARASKRVPGWTLGDRGTATAARLEAQLPPAAHVPFATDFRPPDGNSFGQARPVQGKAHPFPSESLNNRRRCDRARGKRRPHSYSKAGENLAASILDCIVQQCGGELAPELKPIPIEQSPKARNCFRWILSPIGAARGSARFTGRSEFFLGLARNLSTTVAFASWTTER